MKTYPVLRPKNLTKLLKLFKQSYKGYKLQIIILACLGAISGILEGIGANTIIPLFSYFTKDNDPGNPNIITELTQTVFNNLNFDFSLKQILIFIVILFFLKAITEIVIVNLKLRITANYEEKTRSKLLQKTLRANWPHLLKQRLGHLENIIRVDVGNSANFLQRSNEIIIVLINLVIYSFVAVSISFKITLITAMIGISLLLLFGPLMKKAKNASKEMVKTNKIMAHFINENILGTKTVKIMANEKEVTEVGNNIFYEYKKTRIKILFLKHIISPIMQFLSIFFICIIFAISYKSSGFQFASLIAIIYLIQRIFQYIQKLQSNIHAISETVPYLQSILDYEQDISKNSEKNNGLSNFKFNNKIQFKDVYFSYNNNSKNVLKNINFEINKGEMIGLIGSSGSGKTTIVDLILKLLAPTGGNIFIDDKSITGISALDLRKNIGYVSQDIFLKNDTIENNIKFYDENITYDTIKSSAKLANIYDFIETLPDKFSTTVGEKGVMLSAGQRQRIVIARIIARNPKVLILDEATSALDNESEIKIQKSIENLKGKMTLIVIAHRLSTIINSDKLLVLENGEIKEQGNPQKLLKDKDTYFYKNYNIKR